MELVPRRGSQGQWDLSTSGASLGSEEVPGLRMPFLTDYQQHPRILGEAPLRHSIRRDSCLGEWNKDPSLHSSHLQG